MKTNQNLIQSFVDKVAEFHNAFRVKRGNVDVQLRYDLFMEEYEEYESAENLTERADAIVDMLYIACGTLDVHKDKTTVDTSKLSFKDIDPIEVVLTDIKMDLYFYLTEESIYDINNALIGVLELAYINGIYDILPELFNEVHASNMSKLGENGKPIINDGVLDPRKPIGKVLKGKNYFEPNLKAIIEKLN